MNVEQNRETSTGVYVYFCGYGSSYLSLVSDTISEYLLVKTYLRHKYLPENMLTQSWIKGITGTYREMDRKV